MANVIRASMPSVKRLTFHLLIVCLLTESLVNSASIGTNTPRSDLCDSKIYCKGKLLQTVQLSRIFDDSKTFVDHYQLNDPSVTLANFEKMMTATGGKPNRTQVQQYVTANFDQKKELIDWKPSDWQANPAFLKRIGDPKFRQWAKDLNDKWMILAKKIAPFVTEHPERHSLIPVDNGFIVPGGRFQESYYWDSYWVVEGLLLTGMKNTTKGILENFFSMINRYGFVPNGGRVYYLMRSQPPLLTPMVERYLAYTKDITFLKNNLATLEKEFAYFQREKTVDVSKDGKIYRMARYVVSSEGPRPESYREDYNLAENMTSEAMKRSFYEDMKAGAESGWDFSSRWLISKNGDIGSLSEISTRNIIPVDLNAFIQRNAQLLSDFNIIVGNPTKAKYYKDIAADYQLGIDNVLWNEKEGIWLDYDIKNARHRNNFYPSNVAPLYTNSFNVTKSKYYGEKAVAYLTKIGILDYRGGTPASIIPTNEQWDMPNAWPPLQSIIVQGLINTRTESAAKLAKELAVRWLRANYAGFSEYGEMFEKYDAQNPGQYGGGGEYVVQEGFGWTNGVIFEFLNIYPNASSIDDYDVKNNCVHCNNNQE